MLANAYRFLPRLIFPLGAFYTWLKYSTRVDVLTETNIRYNIDL